MINIGCFIQINRKMQASIKSVHFLKIHCYSNNCIQSNLKKKSTYMYAKMTMISKVCVY